MEDSVAPNWFNLELVRHVGREWREYKLLERYLER